MKTYEEFKQYLADCALGIPLLEMATERKNIVAKARDFQYEIADHITKIYLHPNDMARNHWESEVNAWILKIQKMVFDRNKRLTSDQYFKLLWVEPFEHTDYTYNFNAKSHRYGLKKVQFDKVMVESRIRELYSELCKKIAVDEFDGISAMLDF